MKQISTPFTDGITPSRPPDFTVSLPIPPGSTTTATVRGAYLSRTAALCREVMDGRRMLRGRISATIEVHPVFGSKPHDLDNICKLLLDTLTRAGVWSDDSQVDDLHVRRRPADEFRPAGQCTITVFEIKPAPAPPARPATVSKAQFAKSIHRSLAHVRELAAAGLLVETATGMVRVRDTLDRMAQARRSQKP